MDLLSTIKTGVLDSMNLGSLTSIVVFTIFIFWITKWQGPALIDLMGWGFITGAALTVPMVNVGMFDSIISSKNFDIILQWAHFVIELTCVVIAVVSLRDWWIYKATPDSRKLVIQYPFGAPQYVSKSWFFLFLLFSVSFLGGSALAFLISIWPGNQQYFNLLFLVGIRMQTVFLLVTYGFVFSFPLMIELIVFKETVTSPELGKRLQQNLSKLQVVVAGVYFAYGTAMIYLYYILYYLNNR